MLLHNHLCFTLVLICISLSIQPSPVLFFFMVLGSSCVVGIHYVNLVLCVDDGCEMVNIMLAQIVWQRESRRKQHHKHVLGLICDNSVV